MITDARLWRTGDGRLVRDGDAAAATLAYAPGDEVAAADQGKVPRARHHDQDQGEVPGGPPPGKTRPRTADKARGKPVDK